MFKSPVFKFFSSLKLAVFSLLLLAATLAVATCLESLYGTRAVHVLVYGTPWFGGVLFLLALNVLCAALARYPWKKSQTGFVLTHLGIIILLLGSFLTQKWGVDGNMPVVEGAQENEVVLSDLVLSLNDETNNLKQDFPVRESYQESSGNLFRIQLNPQKSLVMDRFIPRAVAQRVLSPSPLDGIGSPAMELELFNSRFRVEEAMVISHPTQATEINLGPAMVTFQLVHSDQELKEFLEPKKGKKEVLDTPGYLIAVVRNKEYRISIAEAQKRFVPFGSGQYEVRIHEYLPYAVVEKNRLVNRSEQPVNPAVHLTLRQRQTTSSGGKDTSEEHTLFANFPEFSTLHGAHQKQQRLGVKFRMEIQGAGNPSLAMVGKGRGKLAFAQTTNGSRLYYRTQGKDGVVKGKGEVRVESETPTGWMDLQFKVKRWIPRAIDENLPRSVEYISGSGDNYLSAIHLREVEGKRGVASTQESDSGLGWWLFEGQGKLLNLGGREIFVQFQRKRLELPFSLFLEKFKMGTDPGTTKAASYQSDVIVKDLGAGIERRSPISMNEPLKYGGYTFYQASYSLEEGQPPVSVFAVNFDPGRQVKYWGSLILTLGIVIMFYMNPHYLSLIFKRKEQVK